MPRKRDPISALRSLLYSLGRVLGDLNAARKGRIARRAGRRTAGKASGRVMRRLFG